MDFKELCRKRYSVRNFLAKPVEKEKIDYILECAQLAPSAANFQPWTFYVVTGPKMVAKMKETYQRDWINSAPVFIVVCKNNETAWARSATDNKNHGDIDAAIASEHICLAAEAIGLGTCWVCNFVPDAVTKALNLADNEEPVALFPLGYIDKEKSKVPEKKRKDLSETTKWV